MGLPGALGLGKTVRHPLGRGIADRLGMGNALTLALRDAVGHGLGTAEGLACAVADRSSEAVALILPHHIGQALTARHALISSTCMRDAGAERTPHGFSNRVADAVGDGIGDR